MNTVVPRRYFQTCASQIRYEACKSDHKSGLFVRRRVDFFSPRFAPNIAKLLDELALPFPDFEDIHRGTQHDLLFLNNGLVARIGYTDHADLIHPGNLQPLAYALDDDTGISVTLSAGIVSLAAYRKVPRTLKSGVSKLKKFMEETGQDTDDLCAENCGLVEDTIINLDLDNLRSGTTGTKIRKNKKGLFKSLKIQSTISNEDIPRHIMQQLYGCHAEFNTYARVYDTHQTLRQQISHALCEKDEGLRSQKFAEFYARCRNLTLTSDSRGLALYRPWTGNATDNMPKPQRHI